MISDTFLSTEVREQLSSHFQSKPPQSVSLQEFFTDEHLEQLTAETKQLPFTPHISPLSHIYKKADPGPLLQQTFDNSNLLELLSQTIDKKVLGIHGHVLKMNWKDYTILNDETLPPPGYDFILDLTPHWKQDFGGSVVYTDGSGSISVIPAMYGSLSIVNRIENLHYYIKYINHHAQQLDRFLVLAELDVQT